MDYERKYGPRRKGTYDPRVRIVVLAVGKLRAPFVDDVAHYEKLLKGQARVELVEVKDDAALNRRIGERDFVSMMDAGGEQMDSEAFAEFIEERRQQGRDVCFVIGGPFGSKVDRVDHRLSFGPMTLPHQLARVVLLEQIYRAHKILAGEPYHH